MKRMHVLRRPMSVDQVDSLNEEDFSDKWEQKTDKIRVRRMRRIKHQLA